MYIQTFRRTCIGVWFRCGRAVKSCIALLMRAAYSATTVTYSALSTYSRLYPVARFACSVFREVPDWLSAVGEVSGEVRVSGSTRKQKKTPHTKPPKQEGGLT
jgi:hypothetical protein